MTKLPKRDVAQNKKATCALRVESDRSLCHSIDPLELLIQQNLADKIGYVRVDTDSAWENFMSMTS